MGWMDGGGLKEVNREMDRLGFDLGKERRVRDERERERV